MHGAQSQGLSFSHILNICHVNLNCLTNKLNHVYNLLNEYKINLLGISETWLTQDITDATLYIPNYNIVRSDNPGSARKHGVALYVHVSLKFLVVEQLLNVLTVYLIDYDVYIIVVYRPPSYSEGDNMLLINYLLGFCCNKEVVLVGDFNLPTLCWNLNDVFSEYISPLDLQFYNTFIQLGLVQIVTSSTNFPSGNILDLFLTTDSERIGSCSVLAPLPRCCHAPVLCSYVFQSLSKFNEFSTDRQIRIWTKGNYRQIEHILSDVDWFFELDNLSPDIQYNKFLAILNPLINRFVPLKNMDTSSKPPWITNPPRSSKRERAYMWQHFKNLRLLLGRQHILWLHGNSTKLLMRKY